LSHQQEILSSSQSSPVNSVSFIGSDLYSSQNGKIFKWKNGEIKNTFKFDKKVKITKLTKGPNSTIIAGGRKLKIFSLKTGDCIGGYSGQTGECSVLCANNKFILSAGINEKSGTVWKIDSDQDEVVCRLQFTKSSKFGDINGNNVLSVGSGDESSVGHQLELFSISGGKTKPIKSRKSLNISSDEGESIEIFGARFCDTLNQTDGVTGGHMTKCDVVYGTIGAIKWEEIDINKQINIERNIIEKKVTSGQERNNGSGIGGTGNAKRTTGEAAARRKRVESINESEMTMAERLGLTGEEKDLKAGSVTNILQQALHSRDKKQIGKILTYTDTKLIKETVKNVPTQLAPVLMSEISARLQLAPERALATSRWLRITLQCHSAPLAAASQNVLESTRLPLELRTVAFGRLKELQGKLELAIQTAKTDDHDSSDDNRGPMVNINDLTDLEDHSHSESDWEAEFNQEKGSESGADSEIESKRRKLEI
jgi:hypothetical protein